METVVNRWNTCAPYPVYIDATFTPVRPGLILNNPQRRMPDEQR